MEQWVKHTHHTQRERLLYKELVLVSGTPSFFWENSDPHSIFGKISKTQVFPFIKGGFQLWLPHPPTQIPRTKVKLKIT